MSADISQNTQFGCGTISNQIVFIAFGNDSFGYGISNNETTSSRLLNEVVSVYGVVDYFTYTIESISRLNSDQSMNVSLL